MIKRKIEKQFASLTLKIIKHRFIVLIGVLLITIALASQIVRLTIDTSNEGFLHPEDPILIAYNDFRDQFGRDDMLVLSVRGENVFSLPFLTKLEALHRELEDNVPHIDDITSLINVRNTRGQGDTLLVDDLLAAMPDTPQELADLKKRVMANPLYRNQLISEDGAFTTLVLKSDTYSEVSTGGDELSGFDDMADDSTASEEGAKPAYLTDQENAEMVKAAGDIAKKYDSPDFRIFMAGSPVVMHVVKQFVMKDMKQFLRLAVLIIGLCLFLMFRRVSGVLLPLLIVALSLFSTLGLMAVSGTQFKVPTSILPSFLLAVGVGAAVHILSLVFQELRVGASREDAVVHAFEHSGLAIVMTSLTTAAGLASFMAAKIAPIADLGLFSAVGVMLSLFYTIVLLPALLAIIPIKAKVGKGASQKNRIDALLDRLADIATGRPGLIVLCGVIISLFAITGAARLGFSHNPLIWLPEESDIRQATATIDKQLKGSVALEVILDTGRENGLHDRNVLLTLDRLSAKLEQFKQNELFIGKVIAINTIIKEIHRALNENRPEFYRIPENAKLIPQEFLLFENSGSDDLEDVTDSQFQTARITIKVPWCDALAYVPFMREIETQFKQTFAADNTAKHKVSITVTGIMSLFGRILYAAIYSAGQSYMIAFAVITLMMIMLIGSLRIGLISMLPNLGPIILVMGIMGWASIPLDMFTMMIASIAIGLAVDDTVHFMYNFRRYFEESGDVADAVHRTFHTSGRAMLTTSIVLSLGFFIFMFASMNNLFYFGLLTGLAIVFALAADLLLAPALMALMYKKSGVTSDKF
ncbi:MMPL family transporter [Desulfococcaceae bacterium HSG9]|nr:MMPL family transporter [Desulfococcaceae bacterium HSG9]